MSVYLGVVTFIGPLISRFSSAEYSEFVNHWNWWEWMERDGDKMDACSMRLLGAMFVGTQVDFPSIWFMVELHSLWLCCYCHLLPAYCINTHGEVWTRTTTTLKYQKTKPSINAKSDNAFLWTCKFLLWMWLLDMSVTRKIIVFWLKWLKWACQI